jgi:K+/H+ antiporter YhaU regulatory subunit KhtT
LQVQVLRRGGSLICQPGPAERLQAGDMLAVLGRHRDLERLLR